MKRKITFSVALAVSALLMSLAWAARGEPPQRFRVVSGVLTPSARQLLRIVYVNGREIGSLRASFVWTRYMAAGCNNDGVCRHTVASQGATDPVSVTNEAVSFDIQGDGNGVQVSVESSSRDALVTLQLIDTSTGEILWADEASAEE